jgi:hypothetical protein
MEPKSLLLCLQEPNTDPYLEPGEYNAHPPNLFLQDLKSDTFTRC